MNNMISELMEVATCKPSIYKKHDLEKLYYNNNSSRKMNELNVQLISNVGEQTIEVECDERRIRGVFLYTIKML